MSHLVVHELGLTGSFGNTELKQLITIGARDLLVFAIRPHLYKHLAPAGTIYLQVQDTNGKKIKDSESVTITDISASNYFHGMVKFEIDVALKKNTQYYVALKSGGGYSYASNAFVGWCNDYDLRRVETDYTTPSTVGVNSPLGMEIWVRKQITKGVYP